MISQVKQEQPQMSIRQLCETLSVNRRWYYSRLAQDESADPDVELRDATLADHPGICRRIAIGASRTPCCEQAGA